ncbi:phage tail tip fiber protein, partial [Providencia sp. Me31A]|uniref:phage tail tip fiber protein n=1 Tax=Providencia sp. Me31A TaxID=3392637 RepID=UPI003D2A5B7B
GRELSDVSSVVDSQKTAIANLEETTTETKENQQSIYEEMHANFAQVRKTQSDAEKAQAEAISQTNSEVNKLSNDNRKIKSQVERNEKTIADTEQAQANLSEKVDAQYEANQAAFVDIRQSQASDKEAAAEHTEQTRAQLQKNIDEKGQQIDEQGKVIDKQGKDLSDISSAVTKNTSAIADTNKTVAENEEKTSSRFAGNEADIAHMQKTETDKESSQAETLLQLAVQNMKQGNDARVIKASIIETNKLIATNEKAHAEKFTQLNAQYENVNTSITALKKTVSDNEKSQAEVNELIKSEIDENKAAIEKRAETSVDQQGNSRAYFSIKAGVWHNGQYYDVKMMMNAQVKNGQVVTQIAFAADEFIIFNQSNGKFVTPFAIMNGQVFIDSGFIQDGSITNVKIGNVIQSNDFKKGEKGWQIDKNGNPEFNNGTFRGKVYATDGDFKGSVYAEKFIGDVATGVLYDGASKYFIKQPTMTIETTVIYAGNMPYDVDLIMPTMHFSSEHKPPAIHKPFEIAVYANNVKQNVIVTTVDSPDSTWAAIASCYIKIPKMQSNTKITVRLTGRGAGGDNSDCTLRIYPALILACKSNPSSFN